ncbi:MAG: STAS domain-containing protein [Ruminococcus sp.]|nr:STAS domain-containing protein [Ruminococcus sp.]
MDIKVHSDGRKLNVEVKGRLDTITAPELESKLKENISGITELSFDFSALEYVSSAGLRVLLSAQKIMNKQGSMVIRNVNDSVMNVFDVTGFIDLLTIE